MCHSDCVCVNERFCVCGTKCVGVYLGDGVRV
jgi:hypothetical protein